MQQPPPPRRVVDLDSARARFGPRADAIARMHWQGDPIGDAVAAWIRRVGYGPLFAALAGEQVSGPRELSEFVRPYRALPSGWDRARAERGAAVQRMWMFHGGIALRCLSLPTSYLSPVGVRPLLYTGRMEGDLERRLMRTGAFMNAVTSAGGLDPGGVGCMAAARVRIGHSLVRLGMRDDGWDEAEGAPIPQPDMAATVQLFSALWVDGVRRLGGDIAEPDADAVVHRWARVGDLMGVDPSLRVDTWREGMALLDLVMALDGPPDPRAPTLADVLLRGPGEGIPARLFGGLHRACARELLGERASVLRVRSTRQPWVPVVRAAARVQSRLSAVPAIEALYDRFWTEVSGRTLPPSRA